MHEAVAVLCVERVRRHSCASLLRERCMRRYIPLGVFAVLALGVQAQATWKPEYASRPPEVQAWYQNADLTEAAKGRFPFKESPALPAIGRTRSTPHKAPHAARMPYPSGRSPKPTPPTPIQPSDPPP